MSEPHSTSDSGSVGDVPAASDLRPTSELRHDPLLRRWVAVAENRANRPHAFVSDDSPDEPSGCPFCEGHEDETPAELFAIRDSDGSSQVGSRPGHEWRVRVVKNKYPAVTVDDMPADDSSLGVDDATSSETVAEDVRDHVTHPGYGSHEVIIESPRHVARTTDLTVSDLTDVLIAYRARLLDLRDDRRLRQAVVFKNVGAAAGATLEHAHSQLMALPFVPPLIAEELQGAKDYYERHGECLFDAMLADELSGSSRIVAENERFVSFCPFASRAVYETWIMPRQHESHFEEADDATLGDLAHLLLDCMHRIDAVLERPAYNYIIHSGPFDTPNLRHYHWYVEVVPRVTKIAGFEWATGCAINLVAPETAAKRLREVAIPQFMGS